MSPFSSFALPGMPRADELLGDLVELARRDAGLNVLLEQRERVGDDRARARHRLDLLR
jgi:hypothetical protein